MIGLGLEPVGGTPDEFTACMVRWGKVIKDAGITAE
jgi:hypothetical protein